MSELGKLIRQLYQGDERRISKALEHAFDGKSNGRKRSKDWYKQLSIYVAYPDTFVDRDGEANLDTLRSQLGYIDRLGCNCLHVLPFLSSPMIDGGFDVSEYFLIREELGGNLAFENLLDKANERGIEILIDIVLNHVSYQHRWYQLATSGDSFYRNFFICQEEKPKLVERFTNQAGVWARYRIEGKNVDIRIMFPEQCGPIPHWNQGRDGWWYYHTFYPHQPDVNWDNYHVFVSYVKTLVYWAKKGVSFRLDALPFVGKNVSTGEIESSERTHLITRALNLVAKKANESGIFLVESNQPIDITKQYFGTDKRVETELAYDFNLMANLWGSLLSGTNEHVWKGLSDSQGLGKKMGWVNFLRNHDELTLEFCGEDLRSMIVEALKDRGLVVRDGFGVAGRTLSFLGDDVERLLMAYTLLVSMPGSIAIVYGDEIGKENDEEYMERIAKQKRDRTGDRKISIDARDINRGVVTNKDKGSTKAKRIFRELSELLQARKRYGDFFTIQPSRIETEKGVFGAIYKIGGEKLRVFVNLTEVDTVLDEVEGRLVYEVNGAKMSKKMVHLERYSACWVVDWNK